MKLETIFSSSEPTNRNVIWLTCVDGVLLQKVYTSNGWQVVGSPNVSENPTPTSLEEVTVNNNHISADSLYGQYKAQGGTKTKEEFMSELFTLIG